MIVTRTHASLVEVSVRSGKAQTWLEGQAVQGRIAAEHTADGWLMARDEAEAVIRGWLDE